MEAEFQDYERNQKWNEIFKNIHVMAERFPVKESSKIENKSLNRYLDVIPFDKTRVQLKRNNLNYINASHVYVPSAGRKYILTQGPLQTTCGHFWLMVWEQNTKAILMLNNLYERGMPKCHLYWPNGCDNDHEDELIFDEVSLRVELLSMQKFDFYLLRKFKLTDMMSNDSREILHFHYTHWPDFDLPKNSDSFLSFLNSVRDSGALDIETYGPPVIHCSAGIGRSGTFVLVDSCLVMIEKNKRRDSINIIDILLEMRKYRMGLIQTAAQLRFSFQTIIEGSKKISLEDGTSSNNSSSTGSPLRRLNGMNEEDEETVNSLSEGDADHDDDDEAEAEEALDKFEPESKNSEQPVNNENELRLRKREEKRQKTMDTINRIKRKQKEVEERLRFNQKLYKYFTPACVGVAICVGLFIFLKKGDASILINYD